MRVMVSILFLFLLSGFVILGRPTDPFQDPEYIFRVGAVSLTEDGTYLETNDSISFRVEIAEYFQTKFKKKGHKKPIFEEVYFPEVCFFPGTRLAKYRPTKISNEIMNGYFLFILDPFPVEDPWRMTILHCFFGRSASYASNLEIVDKENPKIKRRTRSCLKINPKEVIKRNSCMAKIVIDYGVFG